jgi:uncharacterized OB-fold protein
MPVGPVIKDQSTAEFLDGTAHGKFLLRRCNACQSISAPQARQCGSCGSTDLGWAPASGGASVISWIVAHTKPDGDGRTQARVLVIAQLDEGPWWWSQVTDADPALMREGLRLQVAFERAGTEFEYVPVFRAA